MNGFLLDTNVISELVRRTPDPTVLKWFASLDEALIYVSVLSLGELRKGVASLPPSRRRAELDQWIESAFKTRFGDRLLLIDATVAERWGFIAAMAKSKGIALAVIDGLLAATALHHNLAIATRNVSDFEKVGVPLVNPWQK